MEHVEVRTQYELEDALERGVVPVCVGGERFKVVGASLVARDSSRIAAWGSSRVVAAGSSVVVAREGSHVEARESARVVARGASTVVARGSSHVEARHSSHVEAFEDATVASRGSSRIEAWESSSVEARGSSRVEAWDSSRVVAWESSSVLARGTSHVEAHESSTVEASDSTQVEARESSRVDARGSSRIQARGSSSVVARGSSRVVAWESTRVVAQESSTVVAAKLVAVHRSHGPRDRPRVDGGVVIDVHHPTTPTGWCEYHGVPIRDGLVTLFKAVDDDFRSDHGVAYVPGTQPSAPDWDGDAGECGGGLHFSPHPAVALSFFPEGRRFVACEVLLSEIVMHPDDVYPEKVKAPRVAGALYEVDRFGDPVAADSAAGGLTYSS